MVTSNNKVVQYEHYYIYNNNVYNLFIYYLYPIYISCPAFQKFFPKRAAACMFRPYCYLLLVTFNC